MYCKSCGKGVAEGSEVCEYCGAAIRPENTQETTTADNTEAPANMDGEPRKALKKLKVNKKAVLISASITLILAIISVWFIVIPAVQAQKLEAEYKVIETAVTDARNTFDNGIKEITDMSLDGVSGKVDEADKKISELKDKITSTNASGKYSRVKVKKTAADFKLDTFEAELKSVSDSVASLKIIYNQSLDNDKDIKRFEDSTYTYGDAIKNFEDWKTKNDTLKQDLLKITVAKSLEGYKMTMTNALGSKGSFLASKLNASNADLAAQTALSLMSAYADDAAAAYDNAMDSYYLYDTYMDNARSSLADAEGQKATYEDKTAEVEKYNKQADASWTEYTKAIGVDLRQTKKSATA